MFGSDYLLGYSQGRSSAEDERETNALVARVVYGRRPVQVDQSYLDQLTVLIERFRSDSDHNLGKAGQFHGEALYWRSRALPAEADAKALRAQLAERDADLVARVLESKVFL